MRPSRYPGSVSEKLIITIFTRESLSASCSISRAKLGESCFPIVPKLACQHLGLDITSPSKPITLLGGLTSFGGAGNNYSMHVSLD
jgi:hypothetical protein